MAQKATLEMDNEKPMKQPKDAVIRARCAKALKQSVDDIARIQKIDPADVIRIAVDSYVAQIQAAFRGQVPRIGA